MLVSRSQPDPKYVLLITSLFDSTSRLVGACGSGRSSHVTPAGNSTLGSSLLTTGSGRRSQKISAIVGLTYSILFSNTGSIGQSSSHSSGSRSGSHSAASRSGATPGSHPVSGTGTTPSNQTAVIVGERWHIPLQANCHADNA